MSKRGHLHNRVAAIEERLQRVEDRIDLLLTDIIRQRQLSSFRLELLRELDKVREMVPTPRSTKKRKK